MEPSDNAWHERGTPESPALFQGKLARRWEVLAEVEASPNPIYEARARRIQESGYDVADIPSYVSGAGGIHAPIHK